MKIIESSLQRMKTSWISLVIVLLRVSVEGCLT
jgi:hypothetical protein